MKITKRQLKNIIKETYREEREMFYDPEYEEREDLMRQMAAEEEDYDFQMDAEERHYDEQDQMYELAKDVLSSMIGSGISSEALIGHIRRHPDLKFYPFSTIMSAIDELDKKGNITGFLGDGIGG